MPKTKQEIVEYDSSTHTIQRRTTALGDELIVVKPHKRHCKVCRKEFKEHNRFYIADDVEPTIRRPKVVTSKHEYIVCKLCSNTENRAIIRKMKIIIGELDNEY